MALSGRAALPLPCPLWLKQTKVTSLRAFAWEKSRGRLGAYSWDLSLHTVFGRRLSAATCSGAMRRIVRTAFHPNGSDLRTCATALSGGVAAAQYSV
jgi:hypothetical protein